MSVDVRTRVDGPVDVVDPVPFFSHELPAALDAAAIRLRPALDFLDLAPLTVDVDGHRWTLHAGGGRVTVGRGLLDGPALRIDGEQLTDVVHDQVTPRAG